MLVGLGWVEVVVLWEGEEEDGIDKGQAGLASLEYWVLSRT
jgi:hypothetical protein